MSTKADALFEAMHLYDRIDDEVFGAVMKAIDRDPEDVDTWPCEDWTYDSYDRSFELKGAADDLTLTEEHRRRCLALGFMCCWLCHKNGTETHYVFLGPALAPVPS